MPPEEEARRKTGEPEVRPTDEELEPPFTFEEQSSGYIRLKLESPVGNVPYYLYVIEWLISELKERYLWFRGVSRSEGRSMLRPRLYRGRKRNVDTYLERENSLLSAFAREAVPYLPSGLDSEDGYWQVYHLMQHYGVPTRLLDWSESALVALYFAVREPPKASEPKVWILDPTLLNEHSAGMSLLFDTFQLAQMSREADKLKEYRTVIALEDPLRSDAIASFPAWPIAVLPPHVDRRITAQRSMFTVHGSDLDGLIDACREASTPFVYQIPIDPRMTGYIREQLRTAGITESTLFPDLEGISREIGRS